MLEHLRVYWWRLATIVQMGGRHNNYFNFREGTMKLPLPTITGLAVLGFAATASQGAGNQPTFVTNTTDDTYLLPQTSSVCGFPVYEHDAGTVTTIVTTLPDGSVKTHDAVVKITITF